MGTVIPLRPFTSALRECRLSGHPEWRRDAVRAVRRDIANGYDGLRVARQLQDQRLNQLARSPDGAA